MSYNVRVEQFPATALAVVKRRATKEQLGNVIQEACGAVWNVVRSQQIPSAGRHVAIYLDQVFNLEVGVEIATPFGGHGEVIDSALPACEVATTTHFGPYQLLGEAHEAVQQWCKANRREPIDCCWEIYGHWVEEWNKDPSKIRTDVYYRLKI